MKITPTTIVNALFILGKDMSNVKTQKATYFFFKELLRNKELLKGKFEIDSSNEYFEA
jgi:hypothetical protein